MMFRIRSMIALLALVTYTSISVGCSTMRVEVRVHDQHGNPLSGLHVRAESGPFFGDPRGPFGHYREQSTTDPDGEASLKLGKAPDYWVYIDLSDGTWGVSNLLTDETISSDWVEIEPEIQTNPPSAISIQSPKIWMRVQGHELR